METYPFEPVNKLIESLTYDINQSFLIVEMNLGPEPSKQDLERWKNDSTLPTPLFPGRDDWKKPIIQQKIFKSQYHFSYGNCITLDISGLSNNDGMYPIEYEDKKINLMVVHWKNYKKFDIGTFDMSDYHYQFFLHDGTDIGLIGKDISSNKVIGGYFQVNKSFELD